MPAIRRRTPGPATRAILSSRDGMGRRRFEVSMRWGIVLVGSVVVVMGVMASCSKEPEAAPRPGADIAVPPALHIVADTRDSVLFSGGAVKGEVATPLFRGRLTPLSGGPLAAPSAPAGASVRVRVTRAPVAERGEDMTWIKPATGPGVVELPKTPGTAEYVYTGGEVTLHIRNDEGGRLALVAETAGAPAGTK